MKYALLLLASIASAQVTVTVSAGDKELTRAYLSSTRRSVGVWQVAVCNTMDTTVHRSGLRIIQAAAENKLFLYTAQDAIVIMGREQKRNKGQVIADTGEGLSLLGSGLVAAKIIAAASVYVTAGMIVAAGAHYLSGKVADRLPDFARLQTLVIPDDITLGPGACWAGNVLGRKPGKKQSDLVIGF